MVRAIAAQRLAPPVDGDEREKTMLDLVPLAEAALAHPLDPADDPPCLCRVPLVVRSEERDPFRPRRVRR